jgi:hypothetical protein
MNKGKFENTTKNHIMKKITLILAPVALVTVAFLMYSFSTKEEKSKSAQYEFTSFTVVESIISSGMGRSRIINSLEQRDYKTFTTVRTEEDNERNKADRSEIRVKNFEETKLLNFFNMGGIRFQNIAANDAVINSKVNAMLNEGWELVNIVAGVESSTSVNGDDGIFISRFYFKRAK